MSVWQLGNTSVRSAMRIRDGLIALSLSDLQGNIRKKDGDAKFRNLLGEYGIVSLGNDATISVGRKWRSAMGKLGFIYPEVKRGMGFSQSELGPVDTITPAGWNLIKADTVPAMQECYLRAMVTPLTIADGEQSFSPLCWTLAILLELQHRGEGPFLNFIEMACIVQTTTPADGLPLTVDSIIDMRKRRSAAKNKRAFACNEYRLGKNELKPQTLNDYADMNIRYLKASGMVQAKGKGIALVPEKKSLAEALVKCLLFKKAPLNLYRSLCTGTALPTDNRTEAKMVLEDLLKRVADLGLCYSLVGQRLDSAAEINRIRYEIEEIIAQKKEETYAENQAEQWNEIAEYMDLISSHRSRGNFHGTEICIPQAETPAYLEWILWRAFLAIDSLTNKPYEVRRFKIDQDFLPVSTAPGNGPDLIAEFEDCIIVIEVTLSESSRQVAMEGEPVRRHIADLMQKCKKPVRGLFIANCVNSNTAETFRRGIWYTQDDQKLDLKIVPVTLAQFNAFFKMLFSKKQPNPKEIIKLLEDCASCRSIYEAPEWKKQIADIVYEKITSMSSTTQTRDA